MEKIDLKDAIDLHFHAGPDVRERKLTYLEAAIQAGDAGMKAILIKSHSTITADIASLIQPLVKDLLVFGGVALNAPLGGLNPVAVETALKLGAKQVWMPTLSAANQYQYEGKKRGITILTRERKLKNVVADILEILSGHDVILSTGHLSQEEIAVLVRAAIKRKIKKILVTHPDHFFIQMPVKMQKDLAARGVFFDRCFPTPRTSPLTMEGMAKRIREVGIVSSILTSDFGQPDNPFPVEGLKSYIQNLMQQGFSDQEIDQMVRINPAKLLNLT
ncbi:MAG: cytosolic protein [Deltaproteobacteria bacterium]|nr:cytosolic protein [Deltaproteobacteria bacterium]